MSCSTAFKTQSEKQRLTDVKLKQGMHRKKLKNLGKSKANSEKLLEVILHLRPSLHWQSFVAKVSVTAKSYRHVLRLLWLLGTYTNKHNKLFGFGQVTNMDFLLK
jgi:hypothetical protein